MPRLLTLVLAAFLLPSMTAIAAHADSVTFTLNNPTQNTVPGGSLSYTAAVFAPASNTGLEYLNGDSFSVSAPFILNDSGSVNNFPFELTPCQSFTGLLFTLTDSLPTTLGNYTGSFSLLGGSTSNSMAALGTQSFSAAVTPEPSSLALLGTGLLGLVGACRGRVRSRRSSASTFAG